MSQSTLHLGVVMDPISDIAYKKDTTLAMLWAAQERGYTLHYMEQDDLFLQAGKAYARMRPLTVHRNPEHWYDLGEATQRPLAELDVVLMRKDPPVDAEFINAVHLLGFAER
ncbi:MAG TPA: glutathione synthase, partial [Halomonas sp.]|nr:glutathione synthase [Halomonas sp.]